MAQRIELLGGRLSADAGYLVSRSRARPEDLVVLSGTLLEGFGNEYSDLDVYVIGHELPEATAEDASSTVVREDSRVRRRAEKLASAADAMLDIQYYTLQELQTLARSLNELYRESRRSTQIFRKTLHGEDEDLIHKLMTGRILQEGAHQFDARSVFDVAKFCFLKYRNEIGGYPEFRDLAGSWIDGDLDTCLLNTRGYLIAQVSGMMFLAGSTNPRPKWFVRRLQSLGDEYTPLRTGTLRWLCSGWTSTARKREAITSACDLMDVAYEHVRALLGSNSAYFDVAEARMLTEQEFSDRGLRDRDAMAEWQLRRRMFGEPGPSIAELLRRGIRNLNGQESGLRRRARAALKLGVAPN